MSKKSALITGITGQDGTYLTELLLEKGYQVHGLCRRSSLPNTERIKNFLNKGALHLHYGDLTDTGSLHSIIEKSNPDEIYNLAAQSHVGVSFENPEYTANVNGLGVLRLLEAIRILGGTKTMRFYQASTSELFGRVQRTPQDETTPFYPCSPYATSKLYAYWTVINYRESYGMFACNGILFNHESPLRGEEFVTRKITRALGRIALGLQEKVRLGNLDALRDWGHAKDYVEMQWRILQQERADDYIIATGKQYSVRQAATVAAQALGIELSWEGKGLEERAVVINSPFHHLLDKAIIEVAPKFFRPAEVHTLLGDPSKAYRELNFKPSISFEEMIQEMALEDFALAQKESSFTFALS
jgi:GDPmannose 4,6-dehydratase